MEKYVLKKLNIDSCAYFVVSLTYEGILDYIEEIESKIEYEENIRIILIDQLLTTGNNKNRFISCECKEGKIRLFTAKNVIGIEKIRKLSSQILRDNYKIIENSILTRNQKQSIKEGKAI